MATLYYPASPNANGVTSVSSLWETGSGYGFGRIKVDYTINKMSASVTVYVQAGRSNGDRSEATSGTSTAYIDGEKVGSYTGRISAGCASKGGTPTTIANSYFTTIGSKNFTLTADANGDFSKTITVQVKGYPSSACFKKVETATISFSDGWSDFTGHTPTITDNGNNSFTASYSGGSGGTNNAIESTVLSWGYSSTCSEGTVDKDKAKKITCTNTAEREIHVKCVTTSTRGDIVTKTTSRTIKQYVAPPAPSSPYFSYRTKTLPTVKEDWDLNWTAPLKATNVNSPIVGYRIRIFKYNATSGDFETILFKGKEGNVVTTDAGGVIWRYYYDRDNTDTTMPFYITKLTDTLGPGDIIHAFVYAYTKDSLGNRIHGDAVRTSDVTIKNAGIVQVKTTSGWEEAPVFVKTTEGWEEAEEVLVKTATEWETSS